MDIFVEHIIGWVYLDSLPPASSVPKCKRKFDILFVQIFSLKQNKHAKKRKNKVKYFQLL